MNHRNSTVSMDLAPPDKLEGFLEFLFQVLLTVRGMGWNNAPHAQIADLMDAVHNLPDLLRSWSEFDEELFRNGLRRYDEKWYKEEDQ
jgi:hypothetical protein